MRQRPRGLPQRNKYLLRIDTPVESLVLFEIHNYNDPKILNNILVGKINQMIVRSLAYIMSIKKKTTHKSHAE